MSPTILDLSLGAIEISTLVSSVIYGMSLVQTYIYAVSCQEDKLWLKLVVAGVCLFETLHMAFSWTYLYHLSVAEFGNTAALFDLPWYFGLSVSSFAVAGTIVQCFFVWRLYLLSRRNWWLTIVPLVAALTKTVGAIMSTVFSLRTGTLPVFQAHFSYTVYLATIASVITDVWNTAVLCWFLQSRKTDHSSGLVNRIMLWAIETGFITSVAAVLIVVFWSAMPDNALWLAAMLIYAHLYLNSLMVSLNHRSSIQGSLASRQRATSAQSITGPIIFTRSQTQNFDEAMSADTLPRKSRRNGSAISMGDFGHKREHEAPFESI